MTPEECDAVRELLKMSRDKIDLVPYTSMNWLCCVKGCCKGTHIRDYGISPTYWHQRAKGHWFSVFQYVWFCSKHDRLRRRLEKRYSKDHIARRIIDFDKENPVFIAKSSNKKVSTRGPITNNTWI